MPGSNVRHASRAGDRFRRCNSDLADIAKQFAFIEYVEEHGFMRAFSSFYEFLFVLKRGRK